MSMGPVAKAGAWAGVAGIEVFWTIATTCLELLSRLAPPTGSVSLSLGKGTVAENQERKKKGKSVVLKENEEGKLAKMDGKKVAEKSAPVGMAVLVAGTASAFPRETILAPTSALKKDKAKLAREGQSWQGMWEANKVGINYHCGEL
jgi:hypothetical protein